MITDDLNRAWTLRHAGDPSAVPDGLHGRELPATVPGCVHTDLLAAGLIPDPYLGRAEQTLQWIGETDWRYRCTFDVDAGLRALEHVELVCEGLDTVARLELNGHALGGAENMHLAYRFPVAPALRPRGNELVITFASAVRYARAFEAERGPLPHVNVHGIPYNYIRKMACNFGWDWGPTLVTAGIWRPIRLEAWSAARVAGVRPLVLRTDEERADLEVRVDLAGAPEGLELQCLLRSPDGDELASSAAVAEGREVKLALAVERPRRWWPRGYGEQPLYELEVQLGDAGRRPLDVWRGRIGLRSVRLHDAPDEIGSAFTLEVNGTPVFCKGANWIPDDCFPSRIDAPRYRARLEQAAAAGMNTLRVWGGGIYESDAFYRACDELGLMVWQDFAFACAMYPEEPPFDGLVEAEARHQLTRLAPHPSLVLWNGNNENVWGYFDWDQGGRPWRDVAAERSWGLGFYLELLPRLVSELDPSRPYWPSSPYSGSMRIHPNDDRYGCKHVWDAWNERDYSVYRDYRPRFAAEFGHQAPPTYATLCEAVPEPERSPESATMRAHQKAIDGQGKLRRRLEEHFPLPSDFDTWLFLLQVNQARALQLGVEWFRSLQPTCMGTLVWQLNDCWPVMSWAAIDGRGRRKPLYYALRRLYAERLLTLQPDDGALVLVAVNDRDEAWRERVRLRRLGFDGRLHAEDEATLALPSRSAARVCLVEQRLRTPGDGRAELLVADAGAARTTWFFERDRALAYPAPRLQADVERVAAGYRLTLASETLLRDVCLFADRLDPHAEASDQLLTLLPGETAALTITSAIDLDVDALTRAPVLRCVNEAVRAARGEG
jgi:beta-mannosidase